MSDSLTTTVERTGTLGISSNDCADSGKAVRSMEFLGADHCLAPSVWRSVAHDLQPLSRLERNLGKSSCFYCPAMKRYEIERLAVEQPEYMARALALESNAVTKTPRGLGGEGLRWADVVAQDQAQAKLWEWVDTHAETKRPCNCYDG